MFSSLHHHSPIANGNAEEPTRLQLATENVAELAALAAQRPTYRTAAGEPTRPQDERPRRKGDQGELAPRRVRKEHERSKKAVYAAVPKGSRPARHVIRWLRALEQHPEYVAARKDLKRNIWHFANALLQCPGFDPGSMTIMPTWKRLEERHSVKRRSIANYLNRLQEWGLLGVVASGRSAAFTPRATGRTDNEAAIYVLLEPLPTKSRGKKCTPAPLRAVNNPPHATREDETQTEAASPQSSPRRTASRRTVNDLLRTRTEAFWPGNATQEALERGERREAEFLAAAECQHRAFPLRGISTAHVASILRPYLRAGWTVNDVLHAIDHLPTTNGRHHHDGATGVGNIGAWLKHRLAQWIAQDGTLHRSPGQQRAAEAAQIRAERMAAQARRERDAAERAARTHLTPGASPAPSWRVRFAAEYEAGQAEARESRSA